MPTNNQLFIFFSFVDRALEVSILRSVRFALMLIDKTFLNSNSSMDNGAIREVFKNNLKKVYGYIKIKTLKGMFLL